MNGFIKLDANIFFVDGLEVARSRQAQQAGFERALIDWTAFTHGNSATNVAIAEFVQAKEFDALHAIRRGVAQIEGNARSVILRVESPHHVDGMGRKAIKRRILGLNACRPQALQLVYFLLRKGVAFVWFRKTGGRASALPRSLPESVGYLHGFEPIIRACLDRD